MTIWTVIYHLSNSTVSVHTCTVQLRYKQKGNTIMRNSHQPNICIHVQCNVHTNSICTLVCMS